MAMIVGTFKDRPTDPGRISITDTNAEKAIDVGSAFEARELARTLIDAANDLDGIKTCRKCGTSTKIGPVVSGAFGSGLRCSICQEVF